MKFYDYLITCNRRDDRVGDLARDAESDVNFPKVNRKQALVKYLEDKKACIGAMDALDQAYEEFTKAKDGGPQCLNQ